jgi:hypothetical protein
LRSSDIDPEHTGDLLTQTSERIIKKLTLESLNNTTKHTDIMPSNVQDSAMMICYRECLSNLAKFNGDGESKVLQFINNIERIGKMVDASDDILCCMCTAKLDGEAKSWYENNTSLTEWENVKTALLERFTTSDSSSKIFEQLKERKQKPDETITSYHDTIIKLCHEYDSTMSQKMKISWLENGIKDSLKIQIKRQMKLLPESARTTQAFLKIAKDEQELQEENSFGSESIQPYLPYITNTVAATSQQTRNKFEDEPKPSYSPPHHETYHQYKQYKPPSKFVKPLMSGPYNRDSTYQQRSNPRQQRSLHSFTYNAQQGQPENNKSDNSFKQKNFQHNPCSLCQRNNHRTIDCYYKKPHGCYKCGQSDHRLRDCPQVFY